MAARLLLCVLLMAALAAFAGDDDEEGKPAPRFNARTLSGESFNNQSLKGKVVLIQFWTTWCTYCRQEQPLVDEFHEQYQDKGLVVLAVDVGESKKTVKKYLQENPRTCRIVLNDDTNLPAMFNTQSYPVYVAIDREGNLAGVQRGAGGERALRNLLRFAGLEIEKKPAEEEQ